MINLKNNLTKILGALMMVFMLGGCAADGIDMPDVPSGDYDGAQLVLKIALPRSMESGGTRALTNPDNIECKINNMYLLAFCGSTVEKRELALENVPVADDRTTEYLIDNLQAGDYRVFVVANIEESLLQDVRNEDDLRAVILDWSSKMPEAGNLPMVYEPGASVKISSEASHHPTIHTLSLQFACVKVRYNIIFDSDYKNTRDVFGNSGLTLKDVKLTNVSKQSHLLANTSVVPEGQTLSLAGKYYNGYNENYDNASRDNADVVSAQGNSVSSPAAVTKWLWQGDVYLPERYAKEVAKQTTLTLNGYQPDGAGNEGNVRCSYTLPLGGYIGAETSTELPRNTYYEVIAHITTLGTAELDASIVAKDWMAQNLEADFIHTYLTLSKTVLNVNSLEGDEFTYATDGRTGVVPHCETLLRGTQAVNFTEDSQTGVIKIDVNPNVKITELTKEERKGTARCYVTAGNIKKYFSVKYDITPFFTITPKSVKIQYDANEEIRTKVFEYRTNLGGIILSAPGQFNTQYINAGQNGQKEYTLTQNGKKVKISCPDAAQAVGTITVVAIDNPGTTMVHYVDAYPGQYTSLTDAIKAELGNAGKEELDITVMPPLGGYRIYFRAINDYHIGSEGSPYSSEFLSDVNYELPAEGSLNWRDFWSNNTNSEINNERHRVYIYTQFGETVGTEITGPVWEFTNSYNPSDLMTGDANNAGWYYYDLAEDATPKSTSNMDKATEYQKNYYNIPRPGETLMIFNSGLDFSKGFTLHRASHHLDPGIPLFDYEDREGYIVYDPTSEPYYYISDEKPQVENVNYTIYSDRKVTGWYKNYGNASNQVPTEAQRYTIWSNHVNSTQVTINGKSMWKSVIPLKAPRGEYAKAINVKFAGGSVTTPQRVYLGVYDSQWSRPPKVYFYKGGNNTGWNNDNYKMLVFPNHDGNIYYYDVPAGYEDGYVIFQNGNGSSGNGNQLPADGGYQLERGKSKITYTNNPGHWAVYGDHPGTTQTTETEGFILFNGRMFKSNTGYFNTSTKKWSESLNF